MLLNSELLANKLFLVVFLSLMQVVTPAAQTPCTIPTLYSLAFEAQINHLASIAGTIGIEESIKRIDALSKDYIGTNKFFLKLQRQPLSKNRDFINYWLLKLIQFEDEIVQNSSSNLLINIIKILFFISGSDQEEFYLHAIKSKNEEVKNYIFGEKINELGVNGNTTLMRLIMDYTSTENFQQRITLEAIIAFMINHKDIDLNICNVNGNNALMFAIELNCEFATKLVLAQYEKESYSQINNLDHKNNNGDTALMIAVKNIHVNNILELLKHQHAHPIDLNYKDSNNLNIMDILEQMLNDDGLFDNMMDILNLQNIFGELGLIKTAKSKKKNKNCIQCAIL